MKPFSCLLACASLIALLAGPASTLPAAVAVQDETAPVLLRVPNDPTVSFRLWFKVGAQNDPAGKEGLAALTAAMVAEGATRQNSYEQILDRLFPLATSYAAFASMEMTIVSGRTHRDNLGEFYPLLIQAVLSPAFKTEDLERLKSRTLNLLETTLRFASDEELGKAVLYGDIFAGTPYGHLPQGTVAGIKSITVDDVRAFYQKHYTRENVVIGLAGGFDDTLLARLKKDLANLPAGRPERVPAPQPKPIDGLNVTLVEKNAQSTAISFGFPISVRRGEKDWYALALANSWLGEHRSSSGQLFRVLRELRGLNYGDYSYIEHFPQGGQLMTPPTNVSRRQQIFEVWIRPVPHEARHFALRAAIREVDQLIKRGLTPEEFELKREFLRKYVLHYAPTTMDRLGYALDDRFYGITGSHLAKFREALDQLTVKEVNDAIKRHWQVRNLRIAMVTQDADAFAKALAANTPSPIEYATPKPPAVLEEDKAISTYPLTVKRENIRTVPVSDVFAR